MKLTRRRLLGTSAATALAGFGSRLALAVAVGGRVGRAVDPRILAEQSIGPVASESTMFLINSAPSAGEGVAMTLLSPEFQRR